jgi:voltage-gated potassium channel Kch
LNRDLDIVARVHWREEGERLRRLGVREVVWPEKEAGLEMVRHSLHLYLIDNSEVDLLVDRLREDLDFSEMPEVEDELPPEGLGSEPASSDPPSSNT